MSKPIEAQIKGELPIPEIVKIAYMMQLELKLPGLTEHLKANSLFEMGCHYWMNKQIDKVVGNMGGDTQ